MKRRRESVRGGETLHRKLPSTQTGEGPQGPCSKGCESSKGACRGKASQVVDASFSSRGAAGKRSRCSCSPRVRQARSGRLDGTRRKPTYRRGERGRRQGCQRFDRQVRGGQRTPTIPTPGGPPKRSGRRETPGSPGSLGWVLGAPKAQLGHRRAACGESRGDKPGAHET